MYFSLYSAHIEVRPTIDLGQDMLGSHEKV